MKQSISHFCPRMILALAGFVLPVVAGPEARVLPGQPVAALAEDGRTFTLEAMGFGKWQGGYSAMVVVDGRECELSSRDESGTSSGANLPAIEVSRQGRATVWSRVIRFPQHGVDLVYRLGRVTGSPAVWMQAGITNPGKQAVQLISTTPVDAAFSVAGGVADWLVTALDETILWVPPVTSLEGISTPLNIRECGGFYRKDGTGFVFGPAGAPIAFVDATISRDASGRVSLACRSDMSGVRVDPGETRWGQQVVILVEPPRGALARWADWVGETHGARKRLPAMSGWNSWGFLGGQVSGKDILGVVDATLKMPDRLRPQVIQIDGGYEDPSGARESNDRFPEGLAFYAGRISAAAARPGLLLETGLSEGRRLPWNEVVDRVGRMVRGGYTYVKLNTQNITWAPVGNERQTSFELMREGFAAVRKAAGEDTYLLNCDLRPNRAAVGLVDAQRGSVESKRHDLRPTIDDVLRCYHLQGRWGTLDPDAYYLGTDVENVSSINGGWPLVRTWASMIGLSGGTAITSDPWYQDGFKPLLRNVEMMTPPARERAEVLDLCTSKEYPRLVGQVKRDWGDMTVALLWNPGTTERAVTLDFREVGMAPGRRYAVWSFWDNRFLSVAKGSWTTPSLAPSASQHLRFTDLDETPDRPILIGSNLHIYCGAAEIQRVISLQGAMEIELTDAGAREGDLFVYSRLTPVLKTATGCRVEKIAYAGENVWRIAVADRRTGVPQRLEMSILLPVTSQPWFWLSVALAAASLLFAGWHYLAGLRLAREHALQQERSRIARDLHDNIGANLAHIGLLTEQVEQALDNPTETRARLDRIFQVSHTTAKELDAVVWAVDPANDTLEEFARYIHGYAEDYLGMAGIRCHFTSTAAMPGFCLSSTLRHHLLMIAKEALHNVVEHAMATTVTMGIGVQENLIVLEIADDGRGLPPEGELRRGNGLHNMRSRAADVGGVCEVLPSESGRGTVVRLTIPVKNEYRHPHRPRTIL